jgi:hypothetical protein
MLVVIAMPVWAAPGQFGKRSEDKQKTIRRQSGNNQLLVEPTTTNSNVFRLK